MKTLAVVTLSLDEREVIVMTDVADNIRKHSRVFWDFEHQILNGVSVDERHAMIRVTDQIIKSDGLLTISADDAKAVRGFLGAMSRHNFQKYLGCSLDEVILLEDLYSSLVDTIGAAS